MKTIPDLISKIDDTFAKDDITNVPRETLQRLIIDLYDDLNEINGTLPDWWDMPDEFDIARLLEHD